MEKRIVNIKSGNNEVQMEVSQEQYSNYMRPWWTQQQRAKRNRDAMERNGYSQESYEEWKAGLKDDTTAASAAVPIEDIVEKKILLELLDEALETLFPDEKELAKTVLSEEMSLSEFAKRRNSCRTTMSDKKKKVLKKLRKFFTEHGYRIGDE